MRDQPVLIVGGGPVGLTLAIDLGQQGVECLLIDKRPEPSFLPKMERCHARTMEHFRRLGIADAVRNVGYPEDMPLDAFLMTIDCGTRDRSSFGCHPLSSPGSKANR